MKKLYLYFISQFYCSTLKRFSKDLNSFAEGIEKHSVSSFYDRKMDFRKIKNIFF